MRPPQEEMGFLKDGFSETGRQKETHLKVPRGIRNVAQSVECLPGFSEALVSTLLRPGMVVQAYNPSDQGMEARG